MWTLGETLRQARLDKGVSLDEAARDTRIRRGHLEGLEVEDLATLPPAVYTRGLVRIYAEYLGLNPQAMVDLYQPTTRRDPSPPLRPALPRMHIPREIPLRPILYIFAGLATLALLAYLWTQYQAAAAAIREQDPVRSVRGTPTALVRQPTPFPIVLASPSPSPTPTLPPTPTPSPTPVVDGILLELRANARAYVEVSIDGRQELAETLAAGERRTLPLAREQVMMRVSNGSAVDVTVNGQAQEPQTVTEPMEFVWRR